MEADLRKYLNSSGINDKTISSLVSEDVSTYKSFLALKDEHFVRFLKRKIVTFGQHALLWEAWQSCGETGEDRMPRKSGRSRFIEPQGGSLSSSRSTSPSYKSPSPVSVSDRKELFEKYKSLAGEKRQSVSKETAGKRTMMVKGPTKIGIHIGAMIYDRDLKRGVMKKHLPGPRIVEFDVDITYTSFVETVKPMFFSEEENGHFAIANSSGIPFDINDTEWNFQEFVKLHGPPSKLKLYLLLIPMETMDDQDVEIVESPPKHEAVSHSQPSRGVKRDCLECHRSFIAPKENKNCVMPDGTHMRRRDYIDTCPICDENRFGLSWNLYYMDDLASERSLHPDVKPYQVD